ncbi:dynein light chain type 1-domain-containing protein [Tribonema minus]|uniref:Dynein light chain n=1 Tax=Tribonema minus TaxID=303371 RepID=A0A836CJA1_9STRA|nr:dynein light chain type 1-domain-containing protein [Tribonema minus]
MPSMGDDWRMMWGAKVKLPLDMPDDILKDAIDTSREVLDKCHDFEAEGLASAEKIKRHLDEQWDPHWHVVIGRNFGSFVTHETRMFLYFYIGDKAVMMYKAG